MSKDKKKNKKDKKVRVRPPLSYEMNDIVNLARTIITVNPYMKNRSLDGMTDSIMDTITRAFNEGAWWTSTAGYFCYFDEWDENTFVEFYVCADMAHNKLQEIADSIKP
jgi:hypothetical protein